jgi:hypothetical protein
VSERFLYGGITIDDVPRYFLNERPEKKLLVDAMVTRIRRLEKALEFYAENLHWKQMACGCCSTEHGDIARKALRGDDA